MVKTTYNISSVELLTDIEYQQFFKHRICFSIQPQLQLVNLHRNRRYVVIKLHTWFCLSYFLKTNIKFYCIYPIFYEYQQFFQHRICFSIQPPDYSDPWPTLARSTSFFLIMLFNNICIWRLKMWGCSLFDVHCVVQLTLLMLVIS